VGLRSAIPVAFVCLCSLVAPFHARAQEDYFLDESPRLQIRVHIIGEVQQPGEYLVRDDTDVMELISKAGGPTEFANLSKVSIRRVIQTTEPGGFANGLSGSNSSNGDHSSDDLLRVDISAFLEAKSQAAPPVLQPGDIVTVPSNRLRTWQRVFSIVRDIAVVASVYLLYLRIK
jgi:protein involved in polysaccharide export with SLBB domain